MLIGAEPTPIPAAPEEVRALVRQALHRAGVEWQGGVSAGALDGADLPLSDGRVLRVTAALWATGVVGPDFLAASGLCCDAAGCVLVDATLRSVSDPRVFAAGDCAALQGNPRPKAGVWAVRAGRVLDGNLRRAIAGRTLRRWRPQRHALAILGLGDGRAVAWRGGFCVVGRLAWVWKDWLDRRWMRRYARLPPLRAGARAA